MSETKKLIGAGISDALANLITAAPVIDEEKAMAAEYLEQFRGVRIVDAETYRSAKVYAGEIRQRRLDLDKRFTGATGALKMLVKQYDKQAGELLQTYKAAEQNLRDEISRVDDEKQAEKEAAERAALKKFTDRTNILFEAGYTYNGHSYICGAVFMTPEQIDAMPDDAFDKAVEEGRKEAQRLAAILEAKAVEENPKEVQWVAEILKAEKVREQNQTAEPIAPTYTGANVDEWFAAPPPSPIDEDFLHKKEAPPQAQTDFRPAGFTAGFDAARNKILALLATERKFTRAELISLIERLTP